MPRIVRLHRLAPASTEGQLRGLAATWGPVPSDPWVLTRGCFSADVARVEDGEVVPLLWQHARMEPPIGRVSALVEEDAGLRFEAELGQTELARSLALTTADGTTTDVSVDFTILEVDPKDKRRVTAGRLGEISICTTGFAADQRAGLNRLARLGLYDAADALSVLAGLRGGIDRLVELLSAERQSDPYNFSGPEATSALEEAINAEMAELLAWARKTLKPTTGGK